MAAGDDDKKDEGTSKEGRRRVLISGTSTKALPTVSSTRREAPPPAPMPPRDAAAPAKRGEVSEFFNKQLVEVDAGQPISQTRARASAVVQRMPLAVLLPPLGDLSTLPPFGGFLEDRLDIVREADSGEKEQKNEEGMLSQVLQWLSVGKSEGSQSLSTVSQYSPEVLRGVYELGRLYFEMGYFGAAERIFSGLAEVDPRATAARVGLGLIRLERGSFEESAEHFRAVLEGPFQLQARLGLTASFVALGDLVRAKSVLQQLAKDTDLAREGADIRTLYESLVLRCGE